jgi:hypothetical protein
MKTENEKPDRRRAIVRNLIEVEKTLAQIRATSTGIEIALQTGRREQAESASRDLITEAMIVLFQLRDMPQAQQAKPIKRRKRRKNKKKAE